MKFLRASITILVLVNIQGWCASPSNLKVDMKVKPLGIDSRAPMFSWIILGKERDITQSAYEIVVAYSEKELTEGKNLVWSTGTVKSNRTFEIRYQGKELKSFTRYYWKVRIRDQKGNLSPWSETSWFETAMLDESDWKAAWISDSRPLPSKDEDFYKEERNPLLRKEFSAKKEIKSARLYISGLGYYEASINGKRVGDHMLDAALTQYARQVMYSTYDITGLLRSGDNAIGVSLGNGWYNPMPIRLFQRFNLREFYTVGKPCLKAQIRITYTDGSAGIIVTDQSWKSGEGPVTMNSVYLGETFDARLVQNGWNDIGFDDSNWHSATQVSGPAGKLIAQYIPPIRVTKVLKPIRITEPKPGIFIFDFGQIFAGVPRLKVKGETGSKITLRSGEDIHADGTLNNLTVIAGQLKSMWNLNGGPGCPPDPSNIITYTLKGSEEETYTPQFTFSSFRYVEVKGYPGKPDSDAVEGLRMNTDIEEAGSFECSNIMFNQLEEVIKRTFLSNIFSIQSDCPAREKFGYGGDIVATSETFCYFYDMSNFYRKIMQDFANDVRPRGGMPETAPYNGIADKSIGDNSGPLGWQLAFPYGLKQLLEFYGDKAFLEKNYDILKQQVDFIRSVFPEHIVPIDISDHESIDPKPEALTATAFYLQHVQILTEFAFILNKQTDAETYGKLAEEIRLAAINAFLQRGTGIFSNGTQAAQLFAFYHNLVPENEREAAMKQLVNEIFIKHKGHLSTGIFATKYLFDIFRKENLNNIAYTVANQRLYPGYGYMLDHGATTLWESWIYPDTVASQNHPMFGSVGEWFYRSLLGINALEPGFTRFYIKPQPAGDLRWAKGYYDAVTGRIESEWRIEGPKFYLNVSIPANTSALMYIPSSPVMKISEGNNNIDAVDGLKFKELKDGYAVYEASSGSYSFVSAFQDF